MLQAAAITVFLILLTALYVAAEFAAVGARRSRLRRLAEDGNVLAARAPAGAREPAGARPLHRRLAGRDHPLQPDPRRLRPEPRSHHAWLRLSRESRDSMPDAAHSTSAADRPARADGARHDPRRARPQVARAAGSDAHGALDSAADAVVAAALRSVDRSAQRQRRLPAEAARRHLDRPSPRPLARGDRAAHRREPRRRPARAAGTGAAASRAAARPAHRATADGAARAARCRRGVHAVRGCAPPRRHEPVQPSARLPRHARPRHRHPAHKGRRARLHRRAPARVDCVAAAARSFACARRCLPIACWRSCASAAATRRWSKTTTGGSPD